MLVGSRGSAHSGRPGSCLGLVCVNAEEAVIYDSPQRTLHVDQVLFIPSDSLSDSRLVRGLWGVRSHVSPPSLTDTGTDTF